MPDPQISQISETSQINQDDINKAVRYRGYSF